MRLINIKFKKLDENIPDPKFAKEGDACIDLVNASWINFYNADKRGFLMVGTGICVEIPEGYVG